MTKFVDCSTLYLPLWCKSMGYQPTTLAQCITCCDESGKPLAGVVFDDYNGSIVNAHINIIDRPSREWYVVIFDYCFARLGVTKIIAQVLSANIKSCKLVEHFGFVEEARIRNYSCDSDLMMYTMTKDQCRVLNSPSWDKVARLVRSAA